MLRRWPYLCYSSFCLQAASSDSCSSMSLEVGRASARLGGKERAQGGGKEGERKEEERRERKKGERKREKEREKEGRMLFNSTISTERCRQCLIYAPMMSYTSVASSVVAESAGNPL